MTTIDLQPVERDMGALVNMLTNSLPGVVRTVPVEDVRRLKASSLAHLDLGNRSLKQAVQDSTKNLDSNEIGFIRWVLRELKSLFDQKGIARILDEIKTELKAKIPHLVIPRSEEFVHEERKTGVFTFPDVKDKTGQEYQVSLIVDKSYKPHHLSIGKPDLSSEERPSLDYQIPLTGPNRDEKILKLIQDNPNILPEKK